jgi:hypothetical protein
MQVQSTEEAMYMYIYIYMYMYMYMCIHMYMYIATDIVSQTQHFVASKIRLLTRRRYNLQLDNSGQNNTKYIKESNITF